MFMIHGEILRGGEEVRTSTRESRTLAMLVYKVSPILPTFSPISGFHHLLTF
jgi:hypothetical protein